MLTEESPGAKLQSSLMKNEPWPVRAEVLRRGAAAGAAGEQLDVSEGPALVHVHGDAVPGRVGRSR